MAVAILMLNLNLAFERTVAFKLISKVPSFVIYHDNSDEKVTAVDVYERGFKQMNKEITHTV